MIATFPRRGDVYLVDLDPTRGSEIRKTRPCLILSPDDLNANTRTVIIAPLTTGSFDYPFRMPCTFRHKNGHVVLDQIRCVDRERLLKRVARIDELVLNESLQILQEMFSE